MSPVDARKGNCFSPAKVGKLEYVNTMRTKPNEVPCLGGALACEGCPGVYTCAGSTNDGLAITVTDIDNSRLAPDHSIDRRATQNNRGLVSQIVDF